VLVLENPGLRGESSTTHLLYAGIQLLLPGEVASSHRHTANAIRLILEGEGGYTSVDGERASMMPGDFIITPSWAFHDHGNPGDQPVIWLDGLDVPMVKLFDAAFSDPYPHAVHEALRPMDDGVARYARLMPVDYCAGGVNPVFRYPYEETRNTLEQMRRNGPVSPHHGVKLRHAHPGTGGWPTPTMAGFMQLLPQGFEGQPYRATDASVFYAFEGSGVTHIGDEVIAWRPRDGFVAPSWLPIRHQSSQDAVLFSMSDRPAQQALGIWRESLGR
jgi:gentisate 1,2-dioxygenase